VLVGSLEIHVRGVREVGARAGDRGPGGAAVEPDVHRVGALLPQVSLLGSGGGLRVRPRAEAEAEEAQEAEEAEERVGSV